MDRTVVPTPRSGRVLKVAPIAGNRRLADLSLAEIVEAVWTSAKHRDVAKVTEDAAGFVHELATGR
jgi:hypothetical protein